MAIGSGSSVVLTYVEEVTRGVTPDTPTLKTLRATGRNVNLEKELLESAEVRASRQEADVRHGFNQVVGAPGFQLSRADYDDFIQYAMGGTWAAVTTGTGTFSADATDDKFTRAAGSFITDGFRPGYRITVTGFSDAANNGSHLVTAVTATELSVDSALVTEAGDGDEVIAVTGKVIDIGTALKTVTMERQFTDITQFQVFRGVAVNTWQQTVSPRAIVNGSFGLLGMSSTGFSGTSVSGDDPTPPSTNSPMAAFDGSLRENGSLNGVATSLDFTLDNRRTLEAVIGSRFSPDVFNGVAQISGNLTCFFETDAFQTAFFNEEERSLWLTLNDPNGTDFLSFLFWRIKYTGANIDPPQNGPVPQALPFRALEHGTYLTAMTVQRSNA